MIRLSLTSSIALIQSLILIQFRVNHGLAPIDDVHTEINRNLFDPNQMFDSKVDNLTNHSEPNLNPVRSYVFAEPDLADSEIVELISAENILEQLEPASAIRLNSLIVDNFSKPRHDSNLNLKNLARQLIVQQLSTLGLEVMKQTFATSNPNKNWFSKSSSVDGINVIATIPGRGSRVVVFGAHYDTVKGNSKPVSNSINKSHFRITWNRRQWFWISCHSRSGANLESFQRPIRGDSDVRVL